jgi:hypothetical protein
MKLKSLVVAVTLSTFSTFSLAHGGGLDSSGCHVESKTGIRHCHSSSSSGSESSGDSSDSGGSTENILLVLGISIAVMLIAGMLAKANKSENAIEEVVKKPSNLKIKPAATADGAGVEVGYSF